MERELPTMNTPVQMNEFAVVALLKDCGKRKDLRGGMRLHDDVVRRGLLHKSAYVASSLISMYAKCGRLGRAQKLLEDLPVRDRVSWSALISGYAQQGHGREALACFGRMRREGFCPDVVAFTCSLNACARIGALDEGATIHDEVARRGLMRRHLALGTAVVDMYAKCGELERARGALESLHARDAVAWNALIAGYVEHDRGRGAFACLDRLRAEGLRPDSATFIGVLRACASARELRRGRRIHGEIVEKGLLATTLAVGNALVDMYAKCGALSRAREALDGLRVRDAVSWNALIAGCAQRGQAHEAIVCVEQMKAEGLESNAVTLLCSLKACASIGAIERGEAIHEEAARAGYLGGDPVLGTALVDMYSKCGAAGKAHEALEELARRDIVAWNAVIAAYSRRGRCAEAWSCYQRARHEGLFPDMATYACVLGACAGAAPRGKRIHGEIASRGFETELALGNALADMYAKCGSLDSAREALDRLVARDIASWNTLIAAYARRGRWDRALRCYEHMRCEGLFPDAITYICLLKACGDAGAVAEGERIHEEIAAKTGLIHKDIVLGNALVAMYAKCGMLSTAREMLECLPLRDAVSWNALIAGYADESRGQEAIDCFVRMQTDGISPDAVTFLCVLSACSHSGLVEFAPALYASMVEEYGIAPRLGHCMCMVVAFGSAGELGKAASLIRSMPRAHRPALWLAFLNACRKWGNAKLANLAFDPSPATLLGSWIARGCRQDRAKAFMRMQDPSQKCEIAVSLDWHGVECRRSTG